MARPRLRLPSAGVRMREPPLDAGPLRDGGAARLADVEDPPDARGLQRRGVAAEPQAAGAEPHWDPHPRVQTLWQRNRNGAGSPCARADRGSLRLRFIIIR